MSFTVDSFGNVTISSGPGGFSVDSFGNTFNDAGRPLGLQSPLRGPATFSINSFGNITGTSNPMYSAPSFPWMKR